MQPGEEDRDPPAIKLFSVKQVQVNIYMKHKTQSTIQFNPQLLIHLVLIENFKINKKSKILMNYLKHKALNNKESYSRSSFIDHLMRSGMYNEVDFY